MESLAELESVQTRILQRIADLELSLFPCHLPLTQDSSPAAAAASTEGRLSAILHANGVNDFVFKRVPSDYYDWTLEARRDVLGAASIDHLCKSIVLVILDEAIVKLKPAFFWLGGGEVDLKLGVRTSEFINFVNPFIVKCSNV